MPRLLSAAAFLSGVLAGSGSVTGPPSDQHIRDMFSEFQVRYSKTYADDAADRFLAFRQNILRAYELNLQQGVDCTDMFDKTKCVFGVTKFSDMGPEEFAKTSLGYKRPVGEARRIKVLDPKDLPKVAPTAVDWRAKGAVTPVKDQGKCGSCWAFSATEEIESQLFMATGQLKELATQQIVACDTVDFGCNGGNTDKAYAYVEQAGGIDTAADYPDTSSATGETGTCSWDQQAAAKIANWSYAVPPCTGGGCESQDENGLVAALAANGPISVCVNAGDAWGSYMGGVFSATCDSAYLDLDHCVQLVGYDQTGSTPYWILRNSWNADWGVGGYMYLEMGRNLCGVANDATLVKVTAAASELVV